QPLLEKPLTRGLRTRPLDDFEPAGPTLRIPAEPSPTQPIVQASATAPAPPSATAPPAPRAGPDLAPPPSSPPGPALNPPPMPTPGPISQPANDPLVAMRRMHQQAVEQYNGIDSYIVRLTRREQVNGKNHPEEVLLFKFRKQPWSLFFKWIGAEGK